MFALFVGVAHAESIQPITSAPAPLYENASMSDLPTDNTQCVPLPELPAGCSFGHFVGTPNAEQVQYIQNMRARGLRYYIIGSTLIANDPVVQTPVQQFSAPIVDESQPVLPQATSTDTSTTTVATTTDSQVIMVLQLQLIDLLKQLIALITSGHPLQMP